MERAVGHTSAHDLLAVSPGSGGRLSPEGRSEPASGGAAERLDWRPQRPTFTRGGRGQRLPAWAVLYGTAAEDRSMRGPYGIVGVIVTIVVIFVLLRLLGIV